MSDTPGAAREWDDPRMVPANEITKWMDKGWEPCGACMVPATNNQTGEQTAILAYCIRRRHSPVRNAIESTSKIVGARINGAR